MSQLYNLFTAICFFSLMTFSIRYIFDFYFSKDKLIANALRFVGLGWAAYNLIVIYKGASFYLNANELNILFAFLLLSFIFVLFTMYDRYIKMEAVTFKVFIIEFVVFAIAGFVFLLAPYNWIYVLKFVFAIVSIICAIAILIIKLIVSKNSIDKILIVLVSVFIVLLSVTLYFDFVYNYRGANLFEIIAILIFLQGMIINYLDITQENKKQDIQFLKKQNNKLAAMEMKVLKYSYTDSMTGLSNYASFNVEIDNIIYGRASNKVYHLLYMDLDDFRRVNTLVGFAEGNKRLKICGNEIMKILKFGDYLYRVSGSKFALIHVGDRESAIELAKNIINVVNSSDELMLGNYFKQGISIGITEIENSKDFNSIVNQSEIAMYKVKQDKKNSWEYFDESHEMEYKNVIVMEEKIKAATIENVWQVYFQPQLDVNTGELVGIEALIRWFDGEKFIPPSEFIPLAEENGSIVRIGDDVMKKVFEFLKSCRTNIIGDLRCSINVSMVQIFDDNFIETISKHMKDYDIDPKKIILELTETALPEDCYSTEIILENIRKLDVAISVDDFGSGFTSLSYLTNLSVDEIKIDKSYIDSILTNKKDRMVLSHFVELCHDLGLKVVAEGVECEEQLEFISAIGCDYYQGYYFSKPLKPEELIEKYGLH